MEFLGVSCDSLRHMGAATRAALFSRSKPVGHLDTRQGNIASDHLGMRLLHHGLFSSDTSF